jgi:hypothetical protein
MDSYVHKKHFSVDEARKELTSVHALVSKLRELKRKLDTMGWDLTRHQYFGGMGPNGDGSFPPEMETVVEIVRGLEERGILMKGIDQGLVDFPHIRENGEEVYLCWQLGENDIIAWHRLNEGFVGRKGLSDL